MKSKLRWLAVIVFAIVVFQIFFRYEYDVNSDGERVRIDRITGEVQVDRFGSVDTPRSREFLEPVE